MNGAQHLDDDLAPQPGVLRHEDARHPTTTQFLPKGAGGAQVLLQLGTQIQCHVLLKPGRVEVIGGGGKLKAAGQELRVQSSEFRV